VLLQPPCRMVVLRVQEVHLAQPGDRVTPVERSRGSKPLIVCLRFRRVSAINSTGRIRSSMTMNTTTPDMNR
jgi:hypothetical protein